MEYKALVIVLLFSAVCVKDAELSAKVVGGEHITGKNYAVMIHGKGISCSGVMVSETAIITAASCFDSLHGDYSTVFVMGLGGGAVTVHEDYKSETKENDIAIMVMYNPLNFQGGLTLASEDPAVGSTCVATGYGLTEAGGSDDMEGYMEDVTVTACEQEAAGQICAGVDAHGVLCAGDVGSPLICNGELVGIAVSENSCGAGGVDVYQDIKDVRDWILSHDS